VSLFLPEGVLLGNWTNPTGWTGCTVLLAPEGSTAACEVRGGGPGTRESDLLSPASSAPGVNAIVLGGSAYGLAAADASSVLGRAGNRLPHAPADRPPRRRGGRASDSRSVTRKRVPARGGLLRGCFAARGIERETSAPVRAAPWASCSARPRGQRGGLGFAGRTLAGGKVSALAAVNAFGDVLAEDGSILAGVWQDGAYRRTVDLLAAGEAPLRSWRESTTLVCVLTDAELTKTQAWLVARAASAGVARAVEPAATAVDGDLVYCLATGEKALDPLALAAVAADVTAAAIRDAVRQATGAPGCPSQSGRRG
jgi:L-aminopeptidase/D-esterase-like protein